LTSPKARPYVSVNDPGLVYASKLAAPHAVPSFRSAAMAKNRTGNRLERRFRMLLVRNRIRHAVQPRKPLSPDFYLKDQDVYVFLDGCFWHYCPVHHRQPKTNTAYWNRKRARNAFHEYQRTRLRYKWMRVWEHDLDRPGFMWPLAQ
jgi:DNA mismatch endonuclease (patch repair protein)